MAGTEVVLGVAGIAGTALAGVGSNYTTLAVERRRQRREETNELRALRRAIRLVRNDLEGATVKLEKVGDRNLLWPESEPLIGGHLDRYRDLLAAELDDPHAWTAIVAAELTIEKIFMVFTEYGLRNMGQRPPVEGPLVDLFEFARGACSVAADRLLEAEASLGRLRRKR